MPGVIDSFLISLGFKVDNSGLESAKRAVEDTKTEILSMGAALTGLVAGLAVHKIAEIGSTFEQNRIQIAGFLSALGQSSDFNAGLTDADKTIQSITNAAARLPGEAEEYIEVFKAGFPFVKGAMPGGSLDQMTAFTNQLTAIGKTFGLDAGIISREFDHMLSPDKGMASLRLPLFRQLLPLMKQVEGQAHLTAQSFNEMTAPQRLQLLQASFAKLQPMLDASATSFDAMWGAMVSGARQLTRMGTAGIFGGMKQALDKLNGAFFNADGSMTQLGKDTAKTIGDVSAIVLRAVTSFLEMGSAIGGAVGGTKLLLISLGGIAALLTGLAWTSTISKVTKFISGLKLASIVTGLLVLGIALVAEDLWGFYHGADSVTGLLVEKWAPAIYAVIGLLGGLALALSPVLFTVGLLAFGVYELGKHWDAISASIEGVINRWISGLNKVIDAVNKVLEAFGMMGIQHVGEVNIHTGVNEPGALQGFKSAWKGPADDDAPPSWLKPRERAGNGAAAVRHGDLHFGDINVHANDAAGGRAAAREFVRTVRTHQNGVVR